jgi:hypothetical protein
MPRFTSANAREMAARSLAARQAAKMERECPPGPAHVQAGPSTEPDLGIDASRVRAYLRKLDSLLARAKTDREWDNLSRAYDRFFKVLMVVTRTPGPGQYAPRKFQEQPRRRPYYLEPTPAVTPVRPPDPEVKSEMRDVPGRPGVQEQVVLDSPALRAQTAQSQLTSTPVKAEAGKAQPPPTPNPKAAGVPQSVVWTYGVQVSPSPQAPLAGQPGTANQVGVMRNQCLEADPRRAQMLGAFAPPQPKGPHIIQKEAT